MLEVGAAIAVLAAFCAASHYVRENRHPDLKPLEALLIFLVSFSAVATALSGFAIWFVATAEADWISRFLALCLASAVSIGPALAISTWFVRQPPSAPPHID